MFRKEILLLSRSSRYAYYFVATRTPPLTPLTPPGGFLPNGCLSMSLELPPAWFQIRFDYLSADRHGEAGCGS